ncbi:hypothetical protein LIER_08728 [Lithospermum erythrorhizon]|uniref:Dicer-like 3 n=1 Tax=Lithospermum erythrorhizon TaxID=34254 RepID=A0AAV3PD71_LITER
MHSNHATFTIRDEHKVIEEIRRKKSGLQDCELAEVLMSEAVKNSDDLDVISPSGQLSVVTSGAGTTKRKELHGMTRVLALSAKWGDDQDGITFHAYHIHFSCNIAEEHYSNFVLLLNSEIDDDVGNIEVDLYLISKFVKASVSAHGLQHLDMDQIKKVKCLHTFLFNGIFGKLIGRSSDKRRSLIQTEESWGKSDTMYLLLPVDEIDDHINGSWKIDWVGIDSCVFALEFLKEHAWLNADADRPKCNLVNPPTQGTNSNVTDSRSLDIIHFANKSVSRNDIKGIVVVSLHTGRVYSIVDAVDQSAESTFDGYSQENSETYRTFVEYFREQHGITLQWPEQPLFLLKQSHNAHNLLTDFRNEGNDNQVKPLAYIHMPPELLVGLDIKLEVVKSCYLIPSVMHRLESLMLASQLRKVILCDGIHLPISSSLILEALTTQRCNERFSLERLELLGDSVLKYAISCYLFLKYPQKHEGQLSDSRTMDVCNSNLHQLGTKQNLQIYIRDSPFDPRRWKAPGQLCTKPVPCKHGVDSQEVPRSSKFFTENTKVKVGESCDKGHRWMVSKTISDCVEALVGACFIGGGLDTALHFMKWLGLNVEIEVSLIEEHIKSASLHSYAPNAADMRVLELKLGYRFSVKGLLLEALTHGTNHESDVSYQRLEYLGDSALDLLITRYLYQNHIDLDPGELTDLRSACVSNANFGHASLRHNLSRHLLHSSEVVHSQISEFFKLVSESSSMMKPLQDMRVPKVLGDMMESIAGAILIDSNFNLDEVWRIFKRILSPIVTPDKLEIPPLRQLIELCGSLGVIVKENCVRKGDTVHAEVKVQLEDVLLVGEGSGQSKKVAKGTAALMLLRHMEMRGVSLAKVRSQEIGRVNVSSLDDGTSELLGEKNQKIEFHKTEGHPTDDFSPDSNISDKIDMAVIGPIVSRKGGPRQSLYDLCKQQQWPLPTFQTTEYKSRSPIEILYGNEKRTGFSSFESQITLIIPGFGVMKATGEQRLDKKSSFDAAAMVVLEELERRRKVIIATG